MRPSHEIFGGIPPGSRLSRPPSGMPDFSHAQYNDSTDQVQEPDTSSATIGVKPLIQLVIALFLFGASLFSIAAAGGVMAITTEVGKTLTQARPYRMGYNQHRRLRVQRSSTML